MARQRSGHQAVMHTTFGKNLESGPAGYGKRLEGTCPAYLWFTADAGETDQVVIGTVTEGVWFSRLVNHAGLSTGTIEVALLESAPGEGDGVTLIAAGDLTAAGFIAMDTAADALLPLAEDRRLAVTVSSGTGGETAILSLEVVPRGFNWA